MGLNSIATLVRITLNCDNTMKHILIASMGVCAPFLFVGLVALCAAVGDKLGKGIRDGMRDALGRPPRKAKRLFIDNIPRK